MAKCDDLKAKTEQKGRSGAKRHVHRPAQPGRGPDARATLEVLHLARVEFDPEMVAAGNGEGDVAGRRVRGQRLCLSRARRRGSHHHRMGFSALDLARVKEMLARPILVDLRNIYPIKSMIALGFRYVCVGRGFNGEGSSGS